MELRMKESIHFLIHGICTNWQRLLLLIACTLPTAISIFRRETAFIIFVVLVTARAILLALVLFLHYKFIYWVSIFVLHLRNHHLLLLCLIFLILLKHHFLCFYLVVNVLEFLLLKNLPILYIIVFVLLMLVSALHELRDVWVLVLEVSKHLTVFIGSYIGWILCRLNVMITLINMILKMLFILLIFDNCGRIYVLFLIELECNYFFVASSMLRRAHTFLSGKVTHFFCWDRSFSFRCGSTIHAASLSFNVRFSSRRWFIIRNSTFFVSVLIFCLGTMIELNLLADARKLFRRKLFLQSHQLIWLLVILKKSE